MIFCQKRKLLSYALVAVLGITGCVAAGPGDPELFRKRLEWAVEHGRSVDQMFLGPGGEGFRREARPDHDGGVIWLYINDKTGCRLEYITDATGRGIGYRYLSPEDACYIERRFRGW